MTPRIVAAALTACCAVLASCSGVPSESDVVIGPAPAATRDAEFVRPVVPGPRQGMTAGEVVSGFLAANAAAEADFAVARSYLTPEAAAAWDPSAGVTVHSDDGVEITADGELAVLQGVATGRIDPAGTRTTAARQDGFTRRLTLRLVQDQWRIAELADGLLLAEADVGRVFEAVNAYFLTPEGSAVVPDPRWVYRRGTEALATSAVLVTLAGPGGHLADAVATSIPAGTRLTLNSVPVVAGAARIDLDGGVLDLDEDERRLALAQLAWSLVQVPGVSSMEVTVSGSPLTVSGYANPGTLDQWQRYDPDRDLAAEGLYGLDSQGRPVRIGSDSTEALVPNAPRADRLSVQPNGSLVAVRRRGGSSIWVGDTSRPSEPGVRLPRGSAAGPVAAGPVAAGPVAAGPVVDSVDRVWWVGGGVRMARSAPGGSRLQQVPVEVTGLRDPVVAMSVSRDAVRAALVHGAAGRRAVHLATIDDRRGSGAAAPVALSAYQTVGVPDADPVAVAWVDSGRLALLVTRNGSTRVLTVDLSGSVLSDVPAHPEAIAVSASGGRMPIVTTPTGLSYRITGPGPRRIPEARWVTFPGG